MESTEDDVKFSRLAIDEARKSVPEDTRVHPLVGAVAVKDGEIVATAFRGETGAGDHAEYGLLEGKLKQLALVVQPFTHRWSHALAENIPKYLVRNVYQKGELQES